MKKRLEILIGLALLFTGTGVASASTGDTINTGVPSQVDLPFANKSVANQQASNQQASNQQSGVTFSYSDINITANGTTFLTIDPQVGS